MPTESIDSIRKITQKMSSQELESVRLYISSFHRKYGEYTPKTLILFDLINDNTKKYSEKEIRTLVINGKGDKNTFIKLLSRLREKIYEGLTLDVNINRVSSYSKAILSLYQLRKNTITAQILYTRGLVKEALDLIAKSERTAIRYHYYNELFALFNLKSIAMNFTYGEKEARKVEQDILYYRQLRSVFEKSELYFNSLAYRERKQANSILFHAELSSKIRELEAEPYLEKVDVAQYYLWQLKTHYERLKGNPADMEKNALRLLELVHQYPQLQTRPRMANIYMNLADASLYNRKYEPAREFARKTQQLLIPYSQNYFEVEIFFFHTHFYEEDYQRTIKQLKHIIRLTGIHPIPDKFYIDRLYYFYAYALFMQDNYAEANRFLLRVNELVHDKEGWNIGMRILQVLIRIGQGNYPQADTLIENLHHYVSNPARKKLVKRRDYLLTKLLYKLMQKDYDMKAVLLSSPDTFSSLENGNNEQWQYSGPELIPVQEWLRKKLS